MCLPRLRPTVSLSPILLVEFASLICHPVSLSVIYSIHILIKEWLFKKKQQKINSQNKLYIVHRKIFTCLYCAKPGERNYKFEFEVGINFVRKLYCVEQNLKFQ